MKEKIYTLPQTIKSKDKYLMTANEWLALPTISQSDASINSLNCTSLAAKGLIEFSGKSQPLLQPLVEVNGAKAVSALSWQKRVEWVPCFTGENEQLEWRGTILTPKDQRGFFYRLEVTNKSGKSIGVRLGWQLNWEETQQIIFNSHLLKCHNRLEHFPWTNTLVLEARGQVGMAALAFSLREYQFNQLEFSSGEVENGAKAHRAFLCSLIEVAPGETGQLDLVVGINVEADGAAVTAIHMHRLGFEYCYQTTLVWLNEQKAKILGEKGLNKNWATLGDKGEGLVLRNLFFNYFFSTSYTLDTNELVLLTSRSHRYYVSGAFWSRDAFLWSYPAILLLEDKERSLEILKIGFTRYLKYGSYHSCYIDGTLLYPGFELDELAAFLLALNSYNQVYGDLPWQATWLLEGAQYLEQLLWKQHSSKLYLFSTFLDSSDDPVDYPYLTYANVLVWQAMQVLQQIYKANSHLAQVRHLDGAIRLLKKAINQHCVVSGPYGSMYAYGVNGEGGYQLYDNPTGSLQLLPYYKFCTTKDKVWLNTMSWIYSEHNPFAYLQGRIKGMGGVHAQAPWVLGACNSLLAGRTKEGLEFFRLSHMDNGYACETVNQEDGSLHTGAAFATCAGFVAYSLIKGWGGSTCIPLK